MFHTTRRVDFCDTDLAGIVHFANFFRYMEAAEVDLLRSLGLSVKMAWQGDQLGFPRVAAACDYLRPARFDDILDVTVTLEKIGTKSLSYGHLFTRGGEEIARGRVTCVCCRVLPDGSLQGIEIPPGLRTKLEAVR